MTTTEKAANYAGTAIDRLEALGVELGEHGWRARLQVTPGRVPSLHVQNPEAGATALAEDIYCGPREGIWYWWWSWGEAISADLAETAAIIGRVLRSAEPLHAPEGP
jgi:hypothetical protein